MRLKGINMKKCKKILPIVVVILLLLCCVSVNAQVNTEYNKNDWTAQYKLDISEHQLNKTFSANGVDEAKMNVVIKNKTTNILAEAFLRFVLSAPIARIFQNAAITCLSCFSFISQS